MSDPKPVTFEVVAADSGAEIFLIDGNFRLVKKGIGRETFSVPPGIYKVKNRSGRTATERMIVVREGMATVKLDSVLVSSAIPLLHSSKTHEFHMNAARQAGASFALSPGNGSAIVIVARQWTGPVPNSSNAVPPNPARGLTLLDTAGTVLADIEAHTQVSGTFDPCVSLAVALNPGSYRLALAYQDGRRVEQTLIAAPGWQTQIYLLVDGNADANAARVDLINGSITMRKPQEAFDPADPRLRGEEIARGALQDSHNILSTDMRKLITSVDVSPMLALIGAHLLVCEAKKEEDRAADAPDGKPTRLDNRDALRRIVDNLRAAIGSHPDVEALATVAGNPDPSFVFDVPPMFRASWPLLLKASVQRPDSIPAASLNAHVAERIWGEGSWLLWLDTGPTDMIDRAALWQTKARELLSSISARNQDTAAGGGAAAATAVPVGTWASIAASAAAALLPRVKAFFTPRSRTPFPDFGAVVSSSVEHKAPMDLRGIGATLTGDQREDLVKRLGIPMSSIDAWLQQIGK